MFRIKNILVLPVAALLFAVATGASAQVVPSMPSLGVQLMTTGITQNPQPGTTNATMAIVRLDTTSSTDDIRLSSLPLIVTPGNGANASTLGSCTVVNPANGVALNSGTNVSAGLAAGLNTIQFNSMLTLPRGTVTTLNVNCALASNAPIGGTFQFSINTNNVVATAASTGLPASVYVIGGSVVVVPPVVVPPIGFPNTGMGGNAATNSLVILGSLFAVAFGVMYARKTAR